ncbi:MAG: hypothetical protein KDC18_04475 [Alphaproteobacteria bacterium]|nr:hypothetical protein [Alphaproteobacteria bacterium]MCB9930125.1 hypothetical protein [Alphaproteobacteria bacterium]
MIVERETSSGELVESRICPLNELDESEDALLARLVRYWFSLPRNHGVVPDIDNVGLMKLTNLGVLGWFHIVDVHNDDPANFCYQLFAQRATAVGGFSGQRICDIGSKVLQRTLERDLVRAKSNRFPLFQGVSTKLTSHSREYRRVALPLASGTDDVTHLLIGVHFNQ